MDFGGWDSHMGSYPKKKNNSHVFQLQPNNSHEFQFQPIIQKRPAKIISLEQNHGTICCKPLGWKLYKRR